MIKPMKRADLEVLYGLLGAFSAGGYLDGQDIALQGYKGVEIITGVLAKLLDCAHVWNGPRIEIGEYASVGTCGKCGESYLPAEEIARLQECIQRPATPKPRETNELTHSSNCASRNGLACDCEDR
jgi:hypothetical protein